MTSMMSSSDTSMKIKNKQVKLQVRGLKDAVVMGGLLSVAVLSGTAAWAAPGDGLYEVLYTLNPNGQDGSNIQYSLVQGGDGALYGTTNSGGSGGNGTVFKITKTGVYSVINSFDSATTGKGGTGLSIESDNNLYGMTLGAGANGLGSIFKMSATGHTNVLFDFTQTSGDAPYFPMTLGAFDNAFYGTTFEGGLSNYGTVFKLTQDGTFTVLATFDGTNGAAGGSNLVQGSDGDFYGFSYGLENNKTGTMVGTFFKVTSSGVFTTLSVLGGELGGNPYCSVTKDTDGQYLCATSFGAQFSLGAVFKINEAGVATLIAPFPADFGNQRTLYPNGVMIASDGNYYGTTSFGGSGYGLLFKLTPGGQFTVLKKFSGLEEYYPLTNPIQADDGNLYSATYYGGSGRPGAIYRYQLPSSAPSAVTATATAVGSSIQLSWSAPKYATTYNVYQSTTEGGEGVTPVLTGISATTATISDLTIGAPYYFKISAVHDSVESTLSSEVTAIPVPSTPTSVTATGGDNKITLNWSAVSGANSYKIYQATTPGAEGSSPVLTGITGTTSTISGLATGTKYYFVVSAVVGGTESAKSAEVSATTNAAASSSGGGGAINPLMLLALGALSLCRATRTNRAVR